MADEYDPYEPKKPKNGKGKARAQKPAQGVKGTQTGTRAIRALWETAKRQVEAQSFPDDPDPNLPRNGIKPGEWEGAPYDNLPPDCPVRVIGRDVDGALHVMTATGDYRKVEKFDMQMLLDLFAPQPNYLYWAWPGKGPVDWIDADGQKQTKIVVKRVERDKAMACLISAAAKRPTFDPDKQHRGRGGWQDGNGRFIWHSGAWLWSVGPHGLERARPAEHDGFLYTRAPSILEPWEQPIGEDESPALRILEDLRTWKWQRPDLDPVLCLGWLATALMGAAPKSRPIVFTTGGFGVGKSTLHELLLNVLGEAVTSSVNTTAAGIYQQVRHDSTAFLVDELESKPGSSRAESVIELARVAYTGGDISRGSSDHQATRFVARNSFFFSAINPPPMGMQDKSRMAVLNLRRLDLVDGVGRKVFVSVDTDGRMLLRQVMDGWADFQTRRLPFYWDILQQQGLDARSIDTYGTLLAAAEMLVGPAALEEIGLPATEATRLGEIIADATSADRSELLDNWHGCINHLLDSTIEQWRDGVKPTVGGVLERVTWDIHKHGGLDFAEAQERLALLNLGLRKPGDPGEGYCLAIPKDGPALKRVFAGEVWHDGVWFEALKQAPEAIVRKNDGNKHKVRINGNVRHCLLVDMQAFAAYTGGAG